MDLKLKNKTKTPKIPSYNNKSKLHGNAIEDPPSLINMISSDDKVNEFNQMYKKGKN